MMETLDDPGRSGSPCGSERFVRFGSALFSSVRCRPFRPPPKKKMLLGADRGRKAEEVAGIGEPSFGHKKLQGCLFRCS